MTDDRDLVALKELLAKKVEKPIESRHKPSRERLQIQFAQELSHNELESLLQEKLLISRRDPDSKDLISLLPELVHEIKYRLRWYHNNSGGLEVPHYDNRRRSD